MLHPKEKVSDHIHATVTSTAEVLLQVHTTLCPCHPLDELETKKISAGNRVETNTHLLLPTAGAAKHSLLETLRRGL